MGPTLLQDLMFDLLGLVLDWYIFLFFPPCAFVYLNVLLVFVMGAHSSFTLSFRREFRLGLFNNTETVKTLGTLRDGINACFIVRQDCTFVGQKKNAMF